MFSPKQAWSISRATARLNIWDGSVRSGKTYASLWAWIRFVSQAPPGNLLMTGKTERTLKRNILDPLAELLGPRRFKLVSGSGECFILGRRVYIAGANDERSAGKIQGMTLVGAYGDELSLWPESFFTMLLSRLSVAGAKFFGTSNPDSPAHWLKARFLDRVGELNLARFRFVLEDNPALDPEYVAALKREYVGLWYKRYIDGLWVAAEGAIYDMFDADRHVVQELPKFTQHWLGVDYGTTNPTVFLPMSLGVDNVLYFHNEWRWDSRIKGRQMTDAEYSKAFREHIATLKMDPRWTFVDPSAASFIQALHRDKVRGVTAADNTVLDGIRDVSTLLATDRLKFHGPTTKATIEEFQSYAWDEKKQKLGEDAPIKVADHGCDAGRYEIRGTQNVWKRWVGARYLEAA